MKKLIIAFILAGALLAIPAAAGATGPQLPVVDTVWPNAGDTVGGIVTVNATAHDDDGTVVSVKFEFSSNLGTDYNLIGIDSNSADGWSAQWDTAGLQDINTYKIRATATDDAASTGELESGSFTVQNIQWTAILSATATWDTTDMWEQQDTGTDTGTPAAAWGASDEYDLNDAPDPGGAFIADFKPGIDVYFDHRVDWATNKGKYFQDAKLPEDEVTTWSISWKFTVWCDFETGVTPDPPPAGGGWGIPGTSQITLNWDLANVPGDYDYVKLLNAAGDTVLVDDMRTTDNWSYSAADEAETVFMFRVGKNIPPEVTVTYPNGGEVLSGAVTVTAYASDADGEVVSVEFQYSSDDGSSWSSTFATDTHSAASDEWSVEWNTVGLDDSDQYLIRAIATDGYDTNIDTSDAVFMVDNTNPEITDWSPKDFVNATGVITATYDDPLSNGVKSGINTANVSVVVNGGAVAGSITSVNATDVIWTPSAPLTEGSYDVVVTIWDNASNSASQSWSFPVDTGAPAISDTKPIDYTNSATPFIGADFAEPETVKSGIDFTKGTSIVLEVDGVPVTDNATVITTDNNSGEIQYTPAALGEAVHTVSLRVKDNVGNEGSENWTFTTDFTLPVITDWSPKDYGSASAVITATYDDPLGNGVKSGINTANVSVVINYNGGVTGDTSANATDVIFTPDSPLSEGYFEVEVTIWDNAGNSASKSWNFEVDTNAPVISDQKPAVTYTNSATPLIGADFAEPETVKSGIDFTKGTSIVLEVGGVPVTDSATVITTDNNSGEIQYTPAGLGEGLHEVSLKVKDNVGNEGSDNWSFTTDYTNPVFNTWSPADCFVTENSTIITATYDDPLSGGVRSGINTANVTVVVTQNGNPVDVICSANATAITCNMTGVFPLAEADCSVVVTIWDNAGNSANKTWGFTVDTMAPDKPALVSPINGAIAKIGGQPTGKPFLDWSPVTDPNGVIYSLQVSDNPGFSGELLVDELALISDNLSVPDALANGIYYWMVKATDNATNTKGWTDNQTFEVKVATTVNTTFYLGWNMFSLYVNPSQVAGDFGALLGDEISPLFVYWYKAGYEAYPTVNVTAQPGLGYWVMAFAAEVPIAVDGYLFPEEAFTINLTKGWNLIGYPFPQALLWKNCLVKDLAQPGIEPKIILDAFGEGWIDKYFFLYQAEGGAGYQMGEPNEYSWLQPWHALWVKSKIDNARLIIPFPG